MAPEAHPAVCILKQFLCRGALPCHYVRMVVGMTSVKLRSSVRRRPRVSRFLGLAVVEDHLAAVGARGSHFHGGRVAGHHDQRLDALEPCGKRNGLGVIGGGKGDDAGRFLPWGELGNGSVGSPKLEGSDALEILALEKNAAPARTLAVAESASACGGPRRQGADELRRRQSM